MPKLSTFYNLIGKYLFNKGDKDVTSLGTMCGTTDTAYSLHLHDVHEGPERQRKYTGQDEIIIPKQDIGRPGWPYVVLVDNYHVRDSQIYLPDTWDEDWEGQGNHKEEAWCDTDRDLFVGVYHATSEEEACRLASEDQRLPMPILYAFPAVGKIDLRK